MCIYIYLCRNFSERATIYTFTHSSSLGLETSRTLRVGAILDRRAIIFILNEKPPGAPEFDGECGAPRYSLWDFIVI